MTSVADITSGASLNTFTPNTSGGVLGKDDFLRLLVAQLQNQDPLNPSDPTEFTAQLAQFSSLEQLFTVNETLKNMNSSTEELQGLSALSLIDRQITVKTNDFTLGDPGTVDIGYNLEEAAEKVTLYVQDEFGRTVATLPAQELSPGDHIMDWDGRNNNGMTLPPGKYTLIVNALRRGEQMLNTQALIRGTVTGVDLNETGNTLLTSAGNFGQDKVRSVTGL